MVFFRFLIYLLLIVLGVAMAWWLFTGDRRALTFARQLLRFVVVLALIFGALFVLERFVLI